MGQGGAIAGYLEIARFRWWLDDEGMPSSLAAITEETARAYRRHLANQPIGRMTWAPLLYTIKHFFAWACRHDLLLIDPFAGVEVPRREATLPPYLTQAEVKAILDATPAEEMLRDRAILELLYSSALRVRELVQLDLTDIDLAGGVRRRSNARRSASASRCTCSVTPSAPPDARATSSGRRLSEPRLGRRHWRCSSVRASFMRRSLPRRDLLRPAAERCTSCLAPMALPAHFL